MSTNTLRRRETGFFMGDNAIFDRRDVSAYEKIVYLYLCRRADAESRSWPSYNRIAQDCGISRDTAIRTVAKLVEKELLEKNVRKDQNGNMTSNEYILLPVTPFQNPDLSNDQPGPSRSQQPGSSCERLGVVATSDQVVADSDQGSRSQRLGVVADSDPNNTHIEQYPIKDHSINHSVSVTKKEEQHSKKDDGLNDGLNQVDEIINYAIKKLNNIPKGKITELKDWWGFWSEEYGVDAVKYAIDRLAEQTNKITSIASWIKRALEKPYLYPPKIGFEKNSEVSTQSSKAEQKKKVLMRSMYS